MPAHTHHSIPPVLPPANCFTVLVIDDLAANRVILGKFLRSAGYAVVEATNGVEALDLLMNQRLSPDLIVSDVEMPVMDGISLVEQIRHLENSAASVPVIIASGNPDDDMQRKALNAGSDIFLTKPFDLKQLSRQIASLLKSRRRAITPSPLQNSEVGGNRFEPSLKLKS